MLKTEVKIQLGFRGFFRLYTTNEKGEITKDTGVFPNLITNGGLDFIGSCPAANISNAVKDFTAQCQVGTGNTPPADTDVNLKSALAFIVDNSGNGCSINTSYNAGPPLYWQGQRSWQFAAGQATGNIAEIGVAPATTAGGSLTDPLFSRALVVDAHGNPTVIPVLATEALTVTYILQLYANATDTNYSMSLSGTSYSGLFRLAQASTVPLLGTSLGSSVSNFCFVYNGAISSVITGTPAGSAASYNFGDVTYTPGSYTKSYSASFNINNGNLSGGITAEMWEFSGGPSWQMSVSPAIPKTSTYNMTLSAAISWARYP